VQTAIDIRPMLKAHLAEVARVHSASFQRFFLTLMGEPFLRQYYNSVLDYPKSIALVAVDENSRIIGLAVGFNDPVEFYRHFRQYRMRMLPAMVMGLLRRPWLALMILRNAARVSKDGHQEPGRVVELASICSIVRNRHIGTILLHAFLLRAQEMGACEVALTTDELGNSAVRTFYERHGFIEQGREQRGRRVLVNYSMRIDASTPC
jgi:ribosomal protein S18 acetylase RimI-like enzyme